MTASLWIRTTCLKVIPLSGPECRDCFISLHMQYSGTMSHIHSFVNLLNTVYYYVAGLVLGPAGPAKGKTGGAYAPVSLRELKSDTVGSQSDKQKLILYLT